MNRRHLQLVAIVGILVVLMLPLSTVRSQSLADVSGSTWVRSVANPISSPYIDHTVSFYASSMEYEFPDPPEPREIDDCAPISRFCEWLARYDALIETEIGSGSGTDLVVPEESSNNVDSSASENRSVVGWKSASIDALEQQQRLQPVQLDVPSLSISAAVSGVGINEDRSMQVPNDFNTVGWYRHGPSPGDAGSAAIAGHLDDVNGKSVFYDLQFVEEGSEITVTMENGDRREFQVHEKVAYDSTNLPAGEVFTREGDPRLALITCGGDWDSSKGRYSQTVVVYASPV
ncbi:MAG: class F sortase [Thermomicrobiaceae bacterium]